MKTIASRAAPSGQQAHGVYAIHHSSVVGLLAGGVLAALMASCGGGGGSGSTPVVPETVSGQVAGGSIANALVCLDANGDGRCNEGEPQALSDATGKYQITFSGTDGSAPLLAEIIAGLARDEAQPAVAVSTSYRMASPSRDYSTNITPLTTLVRLSGQSSLPLAEDLVRNALGLPARFALAADSVPSAGSLAKGATTAVSGALQALGGGLDLSDAGTMGPVLASLPATFSALPVLRISTKDAAPIVSKEVYLGATFTLTSPAVSPDAMPLNGKIRGRGNTTWGQPKNPYKIQFTDDASYAAVPDFLGMKKNRNWALLADYFDRSLLRNKLALSLGASSVFSDGMKWTSAAQHVEVWLNDDYIGVYLLTEDIRIDPARLNIRKMSSSAAVNDLDGGYLAEVDFRLDCYNQGEINLQLITPQAVPICINTPDESAITQNQLAYIKNLLTTTETNLYQHGEIAGINLQSFVDWYLLNELFRTTDANFGSSVYLWKDTAGATNPQDRLLNMGPIWDFDRSAGNVNYGDGWKTEGCHVNQLGDYLLQPNRPNWLAQLSGNKGFVDLVVARWKQKRPAMATFINTGIDSFAARIDQAQQRNFARWPWLQPNLVNYYPFSNHAEEVAFLKSYLNDRMAWLDQAFANTENFNSMCKQP